MNNKFQNQLKQLRQRKRVLIVLILFFAIIVLWLFATIFLAQQRTFIEPELMQLAEPLAPNLNQELLEDLADRDYYRDNQLERFSIYVISQEETTARGRPVIVDIINDRVVTIDESLQDDILLELGQDEDSAAASPSAQIEQDEAADSGLLDEDEEIERDEETEDETEEADPSFEGTI